jgi:hypothetical protein
LWKNLPREGADQVMESLGNIVSKPQVLVLALVLFVLFMVLGYPAMGALMIEHTPTGAAFDLAFAYSPAEALGKAAMYDKAGRAAMISLHWTYDLAFPAAYGFFLASMWAWGLRLLAGASRSRLPRYRLLLVPLAAPLFDLLENAAVAVLLAAVGTGASSGLPGRLAILASFVASGATVLKWVFVSAALGGGVLLSIAGILIWSKRHIASRPSKP